MASQLGVPSTYRHTWHFCNKSNFDSFSLNSRYAEKSTIVTVLTLKDPFISKRCIEIKIDLNFYFHILLWCFKGFYEDL